MPPEDRERERKALLKDLRNVTDSFPPPENMIPGLKARLQDLDLLVDPAMTGFPLLTYLKQIQGPLAISYERAWGYVRNKRGDDRV